MIIVCVNETAGVRCGHDPLDHDSGGCCKANFCPCSRLVVSNIAFAAPDAPLSAEAKEVFDDMELEQIKLSIGGQTPDVQHCEHDESEMLYPGITGIATPAPFHPVLLDFEIGAASFADLAVWAYKAKDELKRFYAR